MRAMGYNYCCANVELSGKTYFEICPSRNSTVFICDLKSGSCVEAVYVAAAFGTRTGVVGSEAIVFALLCVKLFVSVVVGSLWAMYVKLSSLESWMFDVERRVRARWEWFYVRLI